MYCYKKIVKLRLNNFLQMSIVKKKPTFMLDLAVILKTLS